MNLIDEKLLDKILKESGAKFHDVKDMSEIEMENTVALFDKVSNNDLDRIIIHLQFIRAKRKREFESNKVYGFCDKCMRTFPMGFEDCGQCNKKLRILPILADYSYLLDGYKENKHWREV